jgi:hypothetical protein
MGQHSIGDDQGGPTFISPPKVFKTFATVGIFYVYFIYPSLICPSKLMKVVPSNIYFFFLLSKQDVWNFFPPLLQGFRHLGFGYMKRGKKTLTKTTILLNSPFK